MFMYINNGICKMDSKRWYVSAPVSAQAFNRLHSCEKNVSLVYRTCLVTASFLITFIKNKTFVLGECVSDPEKCHKGITVSFWIFITADDLKVASSNSDQQHQYIISSGGQVSTSRGFSFLYAAEEKKYKLQLQTRNTVYMIELESLPEKWTHMAFTWNRGGE